MYYKGGVLFCQLALPGYVIQALMKEYRATVTLHTVQQPGCCMWLLAHLSQKNYLPPVNWLWVEELRGRVRRAAAATSATSSA
jgi:hypothetical protein